MKKNLQTLLVVLLAMLPLSILAHASDFQSVTVTGTIKDGAEPVPGVNVLVKGTTVGTVSDSDGKYTIEVPSSDVTLVFSFIGYGTQEIRVGGQTSIDVAMTPDVAQLGEVVVVGAVIKKTDLTGAVAELQGEKLSEIPTASIAQAMNGRMTGVLIQNSAGVSGGASIKIRGNNSIQFGTSPIFVVDGVIIDGGYNLINPSDVESMTVLKDASATAIYGSRGANGVVIVTTKKGKKGEGKVTYDGWYGVQRFKHMPRLDAKGIFDLRVDAYANAFMDANPGADRQAYINNSLLDPNTSVAFAPYEFNTYNSGQSYNWLDEVTRDGGQQNHAVSFSKATDEGSYFLSFNYTKNVGLMENSEYNRITGRLNLEQKVKPWLKVGTNTTYARSHEEYVQGGVFGTANAANPLFPIDTTRYLWWSGQEEINQYNPVRSLEIDGDGYQTRLITANYINIKLLKKVNVRSTISVDLMDQKDLWYTPRGIGQSIRAETFGLAQHRNDHWVNWQWDNTVTYDVLNGDHNLDVLAAFSMQQQNWDYNQLDAAGFASNELGYKYVNAAFNRDKWQNSSDFVTSSLMSYVGRANYSYKEKYFATVTARYDGSSKFADGNKWGLFPSAALGWNFAEEQFFQSLNADFINFAKLRVGYGVVGNQNIPNFSPWTLYVPKFTNGTIVYDKTGRLGNPDLRWEKQKQLNIGLDLTAFDNRVNFSIDYFTIKNEDLLMQRTLSTTTGFTNIISNVGEMENKGIEISASAKVINSGGFVWSVAGNISSARNKVTKLYGDVSEIYNQGGFTGVEISREGNLFVGESINSLFMYTFDKIAQESDMDYVSTLNFGGREVRPGDILPKDLDNNGRIDDDDRSVVGIKDPKFYGGFSTDMSFMNFSLNAVFTYNYGAKKLSYLYEGFMGGSGMSAAHEDMLDRWTPTNTNTNIPRAYYGPSGRYGYGETSLSVQDASFLRLSALTLAYNVPEAILNKAKVSNLRIYFTGNNLFVSTKYKGYDPESGDDYPMHKMFVAGINLSF